VTSPDSGIYVKALFLKILGVGAAGFNRVAPVLLLPIQRKCLGVTLFPLLLRVMGDTNSVPTDGVSTHPVRIGGRCDQ
jgi:hypothetical protein